MQGIGFNTTALTYTVSLGLSGVPQALRCLQQAGVRLLNGPEQYRQLSAVQLIHSNFGHKLVLCAEVSWNKFTAGGGKMLCAYTCTSCIYCLLSTL